MSVLVGRKAPSFKASAVVNGNQVVNDFSLDQFLGKKHVLFFFYPKDFTFVCPTELHAFQNKLAEFEKRNVAVVACSTDTEESHWGWLQMSKDQGGIKGVTYPIVADTTKTISDDFGVLAGEYDYDDEGNLVASGPMIAYRGLFLIDKSGTVMHQLVNMFPLGRNVDEALRMVDALQFFEENGEVCPADWHKGAEGMKATHDGVANYLAKH
ncbi:MAG: peroxiredoxin [Flavobacteriales bacterium]|nr:alkyl hydroperoxide reductase [Flavobacteriales bacterium]HRE75067.1 peroxiredoxin [Flavobacteriales bacterium]HRE98391.1 peroxiredoxin [Flavobacteriales bacterium]HRJ35953.1 peroxiredoxin [Flavobacteriales bacterium]